MKNFSDLLAIDLALSIQRNGHMYDHPLLMPLEFAADDRVIIDGIEILPRYDYLADNGVLSIQEPFYRWLHQVTGQGWLLEPV